MSYDIYPGRETAHVFCVFEEAAGDDTAGFRVLDDGGSGFLARTGIRGDGVRMAAKGLGRACRELGYRPGDRAMLVVEPVTGILLELSSVGGDLMETWDAEEDAVVSWWTCVECGDRVPDRRVHWAGPEGEDGPYCYDDLPPEWR